MYLSSEEAEVARVAALRAVIAIIGVQQDELAREVGLSRQYVNEVIHGKMRPSVATLDRLLAAAVKGGPARPVRRRGGSRKAATAP